MPSALLLLFVLLLVVPAGRAQFADPFDLLSAAWVPNRYDPAGSGPVFFEGDNRLRITLEGADGAEFRPEPYDSAFYNLQGRERHGGIAGPWSISAQVFVASAFADPDGPLVRTELWGHTGTSDSGGEYFIVGFTNASPTVPLDAGAADRAFGFRVFDPQFGDYVAVSLPDGFVFDTWHTLSGGFTGTAFDYYLDGALVHSSATTSGQDLRSVMIQGYNFGEAGAYSVHWDNITAQAIPEPAAVPLAAAFVGFGFVLHRRRIRSPRQGKAP